MLSRLLQLIDISLVLQSFVLAFLIKRMIFILAKCPNLLTKSYSSCLFNKVLQNDFNFFDSIFRFFGLFEKLGTFNLQQFCYEKCLVKIWCKKLIIYGPKIELIADVLAFLLPIQSVDIFETLLDLIRELLIEHQSPFFELRVLNVNSLWMTLEVKLTRKVRKSDEKIVKIK